MNQNRRVFRGRAGATDSQLPKHNARRRKPQQASTKGSDKYGDEPAPPKRGSRGSRSTAEIVSAEEEEDEHDKTQEEVTQPPWKMEIRHLVKRIRNIQESIQTGTEGIVNPTTYQRNVLYAVENCIQEWRSILNHYHYHDGSISDSQGVVVEDATTDTTTVSEEIDSETLQETGLAVFVLLQLSLQCGPLQGGSPGYFKRCGGDVAKLVLEYLNRITDDYDDDTDAEADDKAATAVDDIDVVDAVKDDDDDDDDNDEKSDGEETAEEDSDENNENDYAPQTAATATPVSTKNHKRACAALQFSVRQTEIIAEWKRNAKRAALANKPPSKSALKLQQGKSKKSKKKSKKGKKKQWFDCLDYRLV